MDINSVLLDKYYDQLMNNDRYRINRGIKFICDNRKEYYLYKSIINQIAASLKNIGLDSNDFHICLDGNFMGHVTHEIYIKDVEKFNRLFRVKKIESFIKQTK